MTTMLTDRYRDRLAGTPSCYDRIVITGTLPGACYAAGMTSFLNARHIRIFDYPRFAEPLRERIRSGAQALAAAQGAQIEHIAKAHIRKEEVVAAVIKRRGDHPGLVQSNLKGVRDISVYTSDTFRVAHCPSPQNPRSCRSVLHATSPAHYRSEVSDPIDARPPLIQGTAFRPSEDTASFRVAMVDVGGSSCATSAASNGRR
ncbi:hypothetical protein [Accumulibacter sp.]|uniref:hypothetical protein n=1 Tax=Accumulibacter sp. TaxID=2053492 RepID=UPI002614932D|nr:hypothetical protein [Accumulibacter sp.]